MESNNKALASEMIVKTILGGSYTIKTSEATWTLDVKDNNIKFRNVTLKETTGFDLNDVGLGAAEEFLYEVLNDIELYKYYSFGEEDENIF